MFSLAQERASYHMPSLSRSSKLSKPTAKTSSSKERPAATNSINFSETTPTSKDTEAMSRISISSDFPQPWPPPPSRSAGWRDSTSKYRNKLKNASSLEFVSICVGRHWTFPWEAYCKATQKGVFWLRAAITFAGIILISIPIFSKEKGLPPKRYRYCFEFQAGEQDLIVLTCSTRTCSRFYWQNTM